MKRLFFTLIAILMILPIFAQSEKHQTAIENFQNHYNAENYKAIFDDFSPEMQQALPIEQTEQFLGGLKAQVGEIKGYEFARFEQGTYATYKTEFEMAYLAISLSLDDNNQINGFYIKPFIESTDPVKEALNGLDAYPKEIAETIYKATKNLPNKAQVSVAILEKGNVKYYGIIRNDDRLEPIKNKNKIFEIGSISKVFTATVLATLVQEQKLKLTDPINGYYPFTFKDDLQFDFKSLANHTSGLPRLPENLDLSNADNPYKRYDATALEDYLKNNLKISNENTYVYSNLGTGLLGHSLGLSQNTSFEALLQQKIFDRFDMKQTFTKNQGLEDRLVKGLNEQGEPVSNWDFDVLLGAGGILSTTEDLTKFAQAQFDSQNKALELTRQPTFEIEQNMKIGLGWHLITTENVGEWIWHNGGTGGYSSSMAIDIEGEKAVILLANVANFTASLDVLCIDLLKFLELQKE